MADRHGGDDVVSIPRLKLQTDYGQALMWSKGYAADETRAAFTRATELAAKSDDPSEAYVAYFGRWARHFMRGEFQKAGEIAESFLHEAETAKRISAIGAARNYLGLTRIFAGNLSEARTNLEHAFAGCGPTSDNMPPKIPSPYRTNAASYLALVAWQVGDPWRARQLSDQAIQQATSLGHIQTTANAYLFRTILETFREDPAAALHSVELMLGVATEYEMELYVAYGGVYSVWARGRLQLPPAGATDLRNAIDAYAKLGNKLSAPLFLGLLAECEAGVQNVGVAGPIIDDALARATETGERLTDAFLHRVRGDILLKREPADPTPAEEAYRTAIAIAKQQGARSYRLRASLALAKLYQSTGRPADAHAVLAPALEGFSPTPEMPEIAAAQALLGELLAPDRKV
jgi:tetratricopeptide (TPR) repeat protein